MGHNVKMASPEKEVNMMSHGSELGVAIRYSAVITFIDLYYGRPIILKLTISV